MADNLNTVQLVIHSDKELNKEMVGSDILSDLRAEKLLILYLCLHLVGWQVRGPTFTSAAV